MKRGRVDRHGGGEDDREVDKKEEGGKEGRKKGREKGDALI